MIWILLTVNALVCFVIFWVCGTFLLVADRPTCVRKATAQVGLLLAMVGAFATGMAPLVQPHVPGWWSVLMRVGVAMIALAQYDKAFGIADQARSLAITVQTVPLRLSLWWSERLAIAHRNARLKR